jgi:cell wall-associated NlpC family hydrolase
MKKITPAVALVVALGGNPAVATDLSANPGPELAPFSADAYMETARDIMFYALSMVGINYRWGGTSPQTGFDCSGLVSHVFKKIAGQVLPRDSYAMARLGQAVSVDALKPGDLVFFDTMRRPFSHVGIYLGDQRFVHAPTSGKTVHVVDMTEAYWAARYNGARRIAQ